MTPLFELVSLPLSTVLFVSGVAKLRGGSAGTDTALSRLITNRSLLLLTWRGVVAFELILAVALLVAEPDVVGAAASGFFLAAALYAALAHHLAPDLPCGCFGANSEPTSTTAVIRALLLAGAAAAYSVTNVPYWISLTAGGAWAGAVLLSALLLAISPEARSRLTALQPRTRGVPTSAPVSEALARSLLSESKAWRALHEYLVSGGPSESWHEGPWRYLSFAARHGGAPATAVFAIRRSRRGTACQALLRRGLTGAQILLTPEERLAVGVAPRFALARLLSTVDPRLGARNAP